ncbi:hypothetical protein EBS43_03730 [bacterium]|nr:hypothetical protein [bacterium]
MHIALAHLIKINCLFNLFFFSSEFSVETQKMNKLLFLTLIATFSLSAFADIPRPPRPPRPKPVTEMKLMGLEATELAKKLEGIWMKGPTRTGATCNYKVYRSLGGYTQIVCAIWNGPNAPEDTCVIKSSNGEYSIPQFNPQYGLE